MEPIEHPFESIKEWIASDRFNGGFRRFFDQHISEDEFKFKGRKIELDYLKKGNYCTKF